MFVRRWLTARAAGAVAAITIVGYLFLQTSEIAPSQIVPNSSLHLLVPATSSNDDLCRLLVSIAVLNYPSPALISWGTPEVEDKYVQHLAKVATILKYLEELVELGKGGDLVLIVDGFDVQFQLPPEVLLSRYFEENERANQRILADIPVAVALAKNVQQTVIFGPDRYCWPMQASHAACWAVPQSTTPRDAYGPGEDVRARYLNSGTIIGPVDNVRDIFKAALAMIHDDQTTGSDQYFFATIFGNQEYYRQLSHTGEHFRDVNMSAVKVPDVTIGDRTEYHIGLDYQWALFQTAAFFQPYIAWTKFNGAQTKPVQQSRADDQKAIQTSWYKDRKLPSDIANSRPPFYSGLAPAGTRWFVKSSLPTNLGWKDLSLGTNFVSEQIFPVLHFTSAKMLRGDWYKKLWFVPYAEELLEASVKLPRVPFSKKSIGGRTWWPGQVVGRPDVFDKGTKGGAFSGNGTFLPWAGICGTYEDLVFGRA